MYKRISLFLLFFLMLGRPLPAQDEDMQTYLAQVQQAFASAASDDQRLQITRAALGKYPEGEHTEMMLNWVVGYLVLDKDDPVAARAFSTHVYQQLATPEIRARVEDMLLNFYSSRGMAVEVAACIDLFSSNREISFGLYTSMLNAAADVQMAENVLALVEQARPLATEAAFRAEYPTLDYSDEQYAAAGRNRGAILDTYTAYATSLQGDHEGAMELFERAEEKAITDTFGLPDFDLYEYWGIALARQKNYEAAMLQLARQALWKKDQRTESYLRTLYSSLHDGSMERYEETLYSLRQQTAATVADFNLPDYSGDMQSFDALRGKVTLLVFWFPL